MKILEQDDCIPDSMVYFEEKFQEVTGMTTTHFKLVSRKKHTEDCFIWVWEDYKLSYAADWPYYVLERVCLTNCW